MSEDASVCFHLRCPERSLPGFYRQVTLDSSARQDSIRLHSTVLVQTVLRSGEVQGGQVSCSCIEYRRTPQNEQQVDVASQRDSLRAGRRFGHFAMVTSARTRCLDSVGKRRGTLHLPRHSQTRTCKIPSRAPPFCFLTLGSSNYSPPTTIFASSRQRPGLGI